MPVYSNSKLATYENCPRQYKLHYIDRIKLPEKPEGIEAFLGSRVHETLEKLHKELILTKLNSLEVLLDFYRAQWDRHWHENVRIVKKEYTKEHYYNAGREAITSYYRRHHPFDQSKTLATEMPITFKIGDSGIRGYIDRLGYCGDGVYEIHDYKTSGYLPSQDKMDADRQLALYQIGIREQFPDARDVRLVWHYLLFDKEISSTRSDEQLEELKKDIAALIGTIERDTVFEPRESGLCDWCEYPDYCPAKKHGIAVQDLPANDYLAEEGVSLVNKFASVKARMSDLREQQTALEAELDLIREAAVEYARKHELTKIEGCDFFLKVTENSSPAFPLADDERRADLEESIRKAGIWDDVSVLSLPRLVKAIEEGNFDESTRDTLMKYAEVVRTASVRLVKKKEEDAG
jgi:putative RecB family exonuclease